MTRPVRVPHALLTVIAVLARSAEPLVVLATYLGATVLMTFPVVVFLTSSIPMDYQIKDWYPGDGDPWHFLWAFWYTKRAFATFPPQLVWTDLLFYPIGVDIPFLTGIGLLLLPATLLAPLVGLTLTYNLLWILSFVLAGYAMYLLGRHLFHDRLVAWFCGAVFMFSTYRMVHAREHLAVLMASFLVPLFALCLFKTAAQPTVKWWVFAALVLGLSAGTSWYCTIALGVYLAVSVLVLACDRWPWRLTGAHLRAGGVALVVLAVTASLFVLPMMLSPVARDGILNRSLAESNTYAADLFAFFLPSPTNPLFGRWTEPIYRHFAGNPYEQAVYLGYVVLGLALWGVLRASRVKTRVSVVAAVTFFALSLGPFLHVDGQYKFPVDGEEISVPLPYLLLRYVPFVNGMRVPSRFAELLVFSVIVLAGYGLSALCARVRRPRRKFVLVGVLLGAAVIEVISVPFPVVSAAVPKIYSAIGMTSEPFTVLELPLDWRIIKYHHYQTVHGKRLLVGHPVRSREKYSVYPAGLPLVQFLKDPKLLLEREIPGDARRDAERLVTFFDIRYIVIHRRFLEARAFEALDRFIREYFPHGDRWTEGDVVAYAIRRDEASATLWPDDYVIDLGANQAYALLSGWGADERWEETTVQWSSGRESSLYLYLGAPTDRVLEMRVVPLLYEGAPPQTLAVEVNGVPQGRLTLEPRWQQYRLRIPARVLRAGLNAMTFTYGYAVEPDKVIPGSADPRKLAVAFDYIALRRAP